MMRPDGTTAAQGPLRIHHPAAPDRSALISASLAAVTMALLLARGMILTPDGWAYWEGAVSMLAGRGYTYFGGQPIHAFPPAFSALLAVVSAGIGVSGATLALVLVGLAAAAAFAWTSVYARLCGDGPGSGAGKTLIATYVAVCVGGWNQALLADTLGIVLLGAVAWWVARGAAAQAPATTDLIGLAIALVALVLTRNSGLAFLPAVVVVLWIGARRASIARRLAILTAGLLLPLAMAWVIGAALGQTRVRVVAPGRALYTMSDYAQQLANGFADLVAHPVLRAGKWLVTTAAVMAFVWAIAPLRAAGDARARAALAVAAVGLLGTAALWALFNLTWVHDELRGRFLWHLPLILIGTVAVASSRAPATRARRVAILAAWLLVVLEIARVGVTVSGTWTGRRMMDADLATTIRPDYVDRPPLSLGRSTLVSPPTFPGIDRHYAHPVRR
ncbi:MAG: hypothetical protein ACHQ52_05700 [Candidatus Eisenbacteria bacterium]